MWHNGDHAHLQGEIKRAADFFIEVLRRSHERKRGWHKGAEIRHEVSAYYGILREVIRGQGCGKKFSLKPCYDCRILFLTAASNRERSNVRCVLGCRAMRKRDKSNRRTKGYYSTDEGKRKKRALNGQRGKPKEAPVPPTLPLIEYYQWLTWNIDHEKLSREQMEARLLSVLEKVRQHRLLKDHKVDKIPP